MKVGFRKIPICLALFLSAINVDAVRLKATEHASGHSKSYSFMDLIEHSRESTVKITCSDLNSQGTGFFISKDHIATCFHVIGVAQQTGTTVQVNISQKVEITTFSGEIASAIVVSTPTANDLAPLQNDFAVLKLTSAIKAPVTALTIAPDTSGVRVGDDVIFSGFPLACPAMLTHRGMVSGKTPDGGMICVEASINKGNSGGALCNSKGEAIGILSNREGGISQGLQQLREQINQGSGQGTVQIMGVDPLSGLRLTIDTLDSYISTGIGYARSSSFLSGYLKSNPKVLQ